ncbi:hypothetical protein [Sandarakinorhabdus oryzae]|uniref:hypothetical protein n=1 Tax=Sandarakinorhabdus oryzae TaxID=2675220 RepID=UPI0018CC0BDB|nr:hypothetical protein [Sandarakinorhabdus oryzae]
MALVNNAPPTNRRISLAAAANLVGERFHHSNWSENDPAVLVFGADAAPDREAWDRAKHVQDLLHDYITGGRVKVYALTDDGSSITDLPLHWVTDPVFAVCLQSGACRIQYDAWEPCWVDEPELIAVLPEAGRPRKKHSFEWDKIVHEAWMFTLQQDCLPTNAAIVRHLGDWCPAQNQNIPDGSHLSKVAKTVLDFLKRNKTGLRNLDSQSCEAAVEPGR